jgi:hypothetical protein
MEAHIAIAQNICAAANKVDLDPRILAAYIKTENNKWKLDERAKASTGEDIGLYQSNSTFNGHRSDYTLVMHPYYATVIAAEGIKENLKKYPNSWKGIASYWNPKLAAAEDERAKTYYRKWLKNFDEVNAKFAAKNKLLESEIIR